jgi:hypothetical protein
LIVSVLCAIGALLVRQLTTMEASYSFRERAERVVADATSESDAKRRIRELVLDHASSYEEASTDVHDINARKAAWVGRAQLALLIAVVLISVGMGIRIAGMIGAG